MSNSFIELIKKRRTIYSLGNNLPVSQDRIAALIKEAVKHSPTAFNSQSSRVVVLFGENHKKLWNIVKDALRAIVPLMHLLRPKVKLIMPSCPVPVLCCSLKTSPLSKAYRNNSHCMRITSRSGLNRPAVSHSLLSGLHCPKRISAPPCSTTTRD